MLGRLSCTPRPRARVLVLSLLAPLAVLAGLVSAAPARGAGDPIMPLSQVQPGMHCVARTVIQGTTISTFDADVIDIVDGDATGGARILVRVSGPAVDATGAGEGFSGSPVYCPAPGGAMEVAGAISETVGDYGSKQVLVTPIEQMLAGVVTPAAGGARAHTRTVTGHPLDAPIEISGLAPSLGPIVQAAGAKAGRLVVTTPGGSAAAGRFAPVDLQPGSSISAGYSSGDVASGAIGTVTYRDGNTIWAFGHPLDDAGRRSLFMQDAYVYSVVGNPLGTSDAITYKLAAPGHDIGTVTGDGTNAIFGTLGALPPHTTMSVLATDADTGVKQATNLQLADETDVGLPVGSNPLSFVGPLAVASAGTNIYDGAPAAESGRMCLSMRLIEYRKPFGFCNRYATNSPLDPSSPPPLATLASADASSAFSIFDAVTFARLHVKSVKVTLSAQRGLVDGYMRSLRVPKTVRPGQRIAVRLRVRRYRGALVTERFRVRLPRDLPHGRQTLKLFGTAPDDATGFEDLSTIVIDALGGDSEADFEAGDPGPTTLRQVISSVQGLGRYDGVSAAYPDAPRHDHSRRPAFLDPKLRISGTASATLRVR